MAYQIISIYRHGMHRCTAANTELDKSSQTTTTARAKRTKGAATTTTATTTTRTPAPTGSQTGREGGALIGDGGGWEGVIMETGR